MSDWKDMLAALRRGELDRPLYISTDGRVFQKWEDALAANAAFEEARGVPPCQSPEVLAGSGPGNPST